jgi:hypothetical protein
MWSLVIGILGVFANAAFNYVLIFGKLGVPALGIIGAGIGSILANMFMFLGMVAVISYHPKFRRYHLFGRWWRSDWPRFRALWKLGLPIGVTMGLEGGVFGVAVMLMGLIDTASVAAHAIALQVASVTFMVPLGLAQAATVRVGIGYGRRDFALIRRAGWTSFVMGTGFMAAMAVLMWLSPELLIALFIDRDAAINAEVVRLAVSFLAIAALFQIVDGAQVVGAGMLRGLHDTSMLLGGRHWRRRMAGVFARVEWRWYLGRLGDRAWHCRGADARALVDARAAWAAAVRRVKRPHIATAAARLRPSRRCATGIYAGRFRLAVPTHIGRAATPASSYNHSGKKDASAAAKICPSGAATHAPVRG